MNQPDSTPFVDDPTGAETLAIISRATQFNGWMYQTIKPWLRGRVLEIGSGIGNISDFVVRDGYTVTLSDYNPAYCSRLRSRYASHRNVEDIFPIDLQDPDFYTSYQHLKQRYDTIFLLNVIEHLANDHKAVEYCTFMLRPQGRLILLAPAYQSLYSGLDAALGHYRRYRLQDLARLLPENDFTLLQKQYFNALGLFGWFIQGKITRGRQLTAGSFSLFNRLVPVARLLDRLTGRQAGLSAIVTGQKNS